MTKCKYAWYDEKRNTVYINTKVISPDTSKMSFKAHCKAMDEAFAMEYMDRIEKYATDIQKAELIEFLAEHDGCEISEYLNA